MWKLSKVFTEMGTTKTGNQWESFAREFERPKQRVDGKYYEVEDIWNQSDGDITRGRKAEYDDVKVELVS